MAETRTARLGLPQWSAGTDSPSRADFNEAFARLEGLDATIGGGAAMYLQDTAANRPASGKAGRLFRATDTGVFSWDTGAAWVALVPPVAKTLRIDKTWAYDGTVAVNTLPGFYVSLPAGQTAVLAAARHATAAGTATASVLVNGVAATGFGALALSTTSTLTDPANVAVGDGDYVSLDITAAASATDLRFSLFMDVTV